ncbi:hypothetical protein B0H17DRAFT_1161575 [Mycena rosella]|uniref:Protein CPL1-like domain-containing protein n=1 Tax=Mycena rosella TaxID=1033263 RepID=A0AAD7D2H2_MYCRO|nr:hypothetical protein B0H17DRAFT_1161575 [Mycena rosella]
MHFTWAYTAIAFASTLISPARGANDLFNRDVSIDVCGEVDEVLKVNFLGQSLPVGVIKECLCISTIPQYIAGNLLALGEAIALVGKANIIAELTNMVNNCGGRTQCHYPLHSVPSCKSGSHASLHARCLASNGYSAYPAGPYPTQCVCSYPYTECNGKCGTFRGCPSTYYTKRDIWSAYKCHKGLTACGVPGRNSWECIDTQNDLESCGGCPYSDLSTFEAVGNDCTAIHGVSDVSCIRGQCVVHKCMSGYDIGARRSECIYTEGSDPEVLAAQYGLEHSPF